ncbi:unnamed protein product [Paramecium pentaurelia]|uniref:Uncharacterized protein n=1 Tax=Paramecium pentaurelia TaxID=43138 RepID=A0A8S1W8C1_9CILI|nr:unnamed protein product [Paramecium pentaurelia]
MNLATKPNWKRLLQRFNLCPMNINSWKIDPFPQILWLPQNCVCEITSLQHNDVFDIQKSFGICQENIRERQQICRFEKPKKEKNREINKKSNNWNMNMNKKELEKTIECILRIRIQNGNRNGNGNSIRNWIWIRKEKKRKNMKSKIMLTGTHIIMK